jgi:putative regulator of septum formation
MEVSVQGWVIRIGIIAVIAIGALVLRDRLSSNASELKVGDCFDEPTASAETVEDVQHQPCGEAHDNEVMVVTTHPAAEGAGYPSDTEMESFVDTQCVTAYKPYTGREPTTEAEIGLAWYVPTREGWTDGTRKVICYLYRIDKAKMTAPLRATP